MHSAIDLQLLIGSFCYSHRLEYMNPPLLSYIGHNRCSGDYAGDAVIWSMDAQQVTLATTRPRTTVFEVHISV